MDDERSQEAHFGLVMPFVVVKSKDGPYDDESYCAGYETASIKHELSINRTHFFMTVRTANVKQLDLVAMEAGYTMTTKETGYEEWTFATFDKTPPAPKTSANPYK